MRFAHVPLEMKMELYIHERNFAHYRSERDAARNEVQHNVLLKLLADEDAKDAQPLDRRH
jgi:hypothetical protein